MAFHGLPLTFHGLPLTFHGVFFTEGSFTKNTPAQVDEMMLTLEAMGGIEPIAPPEVQPTPATSAPAVEVM